jgi:hypothetical protein
MVEKPAPNSINTWAELKECFIKNFQGTCKQPMTIVYLQHCVQREDESAHHWARQVASIIHSSDSIQAAQALLLLEKNYHFQPLVQKLGRLKRKCTNMGNLMDVLTRYADSDLTKDPSSDDDKSGKGKKNGGGKGQQQNAPSQNGNHYNHVNGGKRKHFDGGSDFVANTNAGLKN